MVRQKSKSQRFPAVLAFILAILAALPVGAQEVTAWFAKGSNEQIYGSIHTEIDTLSATLAASGLGDSLLAWRLTEAASKKVQAAQLLDALRLDVARSVATARMLSERGLLPADPKKASGLARQALIFFRAGLMEGDFAVILSESTKRLGINAKPEDIVARTMVVMSEVANMQAVYGLSAQERLELETALASSALSDSKLKSITEKIVALVRKNKPISEAIGSVVGETRGASGKPANQDNKPDKSEKSDKPEKPETPGNSDHSGKKGL